MADIIKHQGIVESINGAHVRVKILQTSACASCSAKGHCGSADNKEKMVDIYNVASHSSYSLGQEVTIYGTTSMGLQAVLIAFVIPFIILIATLAVVLSVADDNEPMAALFSLIALIPYYVCVYLFRHKLSKKFSFTLKPINY